MSAPLLTHFDDSICGSCRRSLGPRGSKCFTIDTDRYSSGLLCKDCALTGLLPVFVTVHEADLRTILDLALTVEDRSDEENHALSRLSALLKPLQTTAGVGE